MTQPQPTSAQPIYGCADVAQLLRVTNAAISNYRTRHDDTPAPAYVTTDGRPYWTAAGMAAWQAWQDSRRNTGARGAARSAAARDAVERLRAELPDISVS